MSARLAALVLLLGATAAAAEPPAVRVCWGYGCDHSARVTLPGADWDALHALFTPAAPDPATERRRIAGAIARFERAVGPLTGTEADRYENATGSGLPGQQDCIDESRNTTAYLRVLADRGLLAWHRVELRAYRVRWVLDQHWTAVVRDRSTGRRWAVDSWFLDNGRRPYVQRLSAWQDMEPLPPNPDAEGGRRRLARAPDGHGRDGRR